MLSGTKECIRELCVDSRSWHQVEREAQVLRSLKACPLFPSLVYSGVWNRKPALLSTLDGLPLWERYDSRLISALDAQWLCRDLTHAVFELYDHDYFHRDIRSHNIGVYTSPRTDGRRFYLFDLGVAVEVVPRMRGARALDLVFASRSSLVDGMEGLMTELVSVAYVCLYVASERGLPWEMAAEEQDLESCYKLRSKELIDIPECLSSGTREWLDFVLSHDDDLVREIGVKCLGFDRLETCSRGNPDEETYHHELSNKHGFGLKNLCRICSFSWMDQ